MKYVVKNDFYLKGDFIAVGEIIVADAKLRDRLLEMDVLGEQVTEETAADSNALKEVGDQVAETKASNEASDGADNNSASNETTKTGRGRANSGSKK